MNPKPDPLAPLLQRFNIHAQMFFSGNFCGRADYGKEVDVGYLHLIRGGQTRLSNDRGQTLELSEPSLVFYSRPMWHWFEPDPVHGVDLVCASVHFEHKAFNPIALALPDQVVRPLSAMPLAAPVLAVLFAEAFADNLGRQAVLNRLFEVVLVELLRAQLLAVDAQPGFLRGLGHPQIGRALYAIHAEPERAWGLAALAAVAGMSRASFAAAFRAQVDITPGEYLTRWRISVAQALLRQDMPLKQVAERVGYESQTGFLKAFKALLGVTPTAWRQGELPELPDLVRARD
ncbi:AraC-like DNA-binding protein [Paraburkholderia bannensis]|uniref:AraC-like DNA-binding protein n=1 Tax=Paraburkholderia bannensis TaxID=765414 RepID=A0A7W9U572_9BURK|nr:MULTISPECIES: AraC family transcriptional regulator [Paraburkholderia]MBB3262200.1 AraC-like DNA-binding protein [Paraburkholderia sp. WP4_3_2]MBB6107169.1 AraC-like DNA-binding protein [Paraburkholderia bannensis]